MYVHLYLVDTVKLYQARLQFKMESEDANAILPWSEPVATIWFGCVRSETTVSDQLRLKVQAKLWVYMQRFLFCSVNMW